MQVGKKPGKNKWGLWLFKQGLIWFGQSVKSSSWGKFHEPVIDMGATCYNFTIFNLDSSGNLNGILEYLSTWIKMLCVCSLKFWKINKIRKKIIFLIIKSKLSLNEFYLSKYLYPILFFVIEVRWGNFPGHPLILVVSYLPGMPIPSPIINWLAIQDFPPITFDLFCLFSTCGYTVH